MEKKDVGPRFAAVYIRVSTEEQAELSPESQMEKLQEYARREGILILQDHVYIDATVIIGLKQNPTYGRRFSPIFLFIRAFCGAKRKMLL